MKINTRNLLQQIFDHVLLQSPDIILMLVHFAVSDFKCFRHTNYTIDVFGTTPHVSLLTATMNKWAYLFVFPDKHEANPFWPVKLMCAGCNAVNLGKGQVVTIMAYRLH